MWRAFSLLQHYSGWQSPLEQEDSCYLLAMGGRKGLAGPAFLEPAAVSERFLWGL